MQLVKLREISKIVRDRCFLISGLLEEISGIFIAKRTTKSR